MLTCPLRRELKTAIDTVGVFPLRVFYSPTPDITKMWALTFRSSNVYEVFSPPNVALYRGKVKVK
jgi:hypothetical protein